MNPPPNPDRVRELFQQALEHGPPAERDAFLAAACGDDEPLHRRVVALLRAHDATAAFLPGQPAVPGLPTGEGPGAVIGRYRLLERIGEGGFGVVFMADQLEPVRRRVALKIIKPGMDSRPVIGRFAAERQALARMEHPGIAQVFDAGTTEGGRPYFVMELVRGLPLTAFCDEHRLGLEARLELFIAVCAAVQHAHQKGVIHRDLKPSNILVTRHGERPVPKVIDFGIAKALGEPLTDETVFTRFQQLLGTPAYMSPEQAALSGLDADTRSDIYSLGVLLYELLTGGPPFDPKELLGAGLDGLRRTLCEREPERPSTRLTRRRRGPAARAAGGQISRGDSRIPRELDLIVLKALEKDRERRYATANGLAADLRRFLHHEPVTAVAPTLAYQFAKLYRRNRKAVTIALAFGVLVAAAAVAGTGLAIRARRAEMQARLEAATAYNVSEFLWKELLKPLTPWSHTNPGVTLREAFDQAALGIPVRLQGQPLAEAAVRLAFARTHFGQAEWPAAETNLLRALALRRAHATPPDPATAEVLFQLGTLREFQGRWADAETGYREAAEIRAQALGAGHRDTVTAGAKAALSRSRRLPAGEAEPLLRRAAEDVGRVIGPEHHVARAALYQLGELHLAAGRFAEAYALYAEIRRLSAAEEGEASHGVLSSLAMMAETRARQGELAEADAAFREVIVLRGRYTGAGHPFTLLTRLQRVQAVLLPQRRFAEAADELRQIRAVAQAGPPAQRVPVAEALAAALAAWPAHGGGPEYEAFRREMRADGERP